MYPYIKGDLMKYLIKIEYDGSKFYGFQRLNDLPTVQKSLEEALSLIDQSNVIIKGAGRTDRGVHSHGQMAHFELIHKIPNERLIIALNNIVRPYINIISCNNVSDDFHARFNVKKKTYVYKINLDKFEALKSDYFYQDDNLNVEKMIDISKYFVGIHDFRNFVCGQRDNYKAIIYDINFSLIDNNLEITFVGKSFYRYMVRCLVGAFIDYSKDKVTKNEVLDSLNNITNKRFSVAYAGGLYLENIEYK